MFWCLDFFFLSVFIYPNKDAWGRFCLLRHSTSALPIWFIAYNSIYYNVILSLKHEQVDEVPVESSMMTFEYLRA